MTLATRGRVELSANRDTYWKFDEGTSKVSLVINDLEVQTIDDAGVVTPPSVFSGYATTIAQYRAHTMWPCGIAYDSSEDRWWRFELIAPAHAMNPAGDPASRTATVTIASPGVFTATAHGLVDGNTVRLVTTGALPTGLAADVTYYVVNKTTNTFELSLTSGGASINTSGSQSGTHTVHGPLTTQFMNRIDAWYSDDGGTTWEGRRTIYSDSYHRPVVAAIGNLGGNRFGGIISCTIDDERASNIRVQFSILSTDLGATWSSTKLTGITISRFVYGILQPFPAAFGGNDSSGYCVAAYAGADSYSHIYTLDNGDTWADADLKINDNVWSTFLQEPSVVYTQAGAIAFLRGGDGVNLHVITSSDGVTWSDFTDTGVPMGANPVHAVVDENDIVHVAVFDRENFDGSATDNTMRTYRIPAATLFYNPAALGQITARLEWIGGNRMIGYMQSKFVSGYGWMHIFKNRESWPTTTNAASADVVMITSVPRPSVARERNSPVVNLAHNPDFDFWQGGTSFAGITTQQVTADRWEYFPSSATATIARRTLTQRESLAFPHRPRYGLDLNIGATNAANAGLFQYHYNEDFYHLYRIARARQELTLVAMGLRAPLSNAQAAMQISYGSGGSTGATATASFPKAYASNSGPWCQVVRLPIAITGNPTIGTTPFIRFGIQQSADAACDTTLTGLFLLDGIALDEVFVEERLRRLQQVQRYRRLWSGTSLLNRFIAAGSVQSTTTLEVPVRFDTPMAMPLSAITVSSASHFRARTAAASATASGVAGSAYSELGCLLTLTTTGLTAGQAGSLEALDAAATILFSTGH